MPFSAMAESHMRLPRASKSSMFWSSRRMFTTVFFIMAKATSSDTLSESELPK